MCFEFMLGIGDVADFTGTKRAYKIVEADDFNDQLFRPWVKDYTSTRYRVGEVTKAEGNAWFIHDCSPGCTCHWRSARSGIYVYTSRAAVHYAVSEIAKCYTGMMRVIEVEVDADHFKARAQHGEIETYSQVLVLAEITDQVVGRIEP